MRPKCCEPISFTRFLAALLTSLILAGSVIGCGTVTVSEERQLGAEIAQQARGELLFIRDAVVLDYVRSIGEEIVSAAGPQPFEYRFEVVEDDEINAFAAPAGYIYIHSGTILQARNVSEVASVLAHEIGHVALRHIAENYDRQRNVGTAAQAGVLAASLFGFGGLANLGSGLASMALLNSFSRADELEADVFAIEVMPAAGYDPHGMLTFLQVVRRESGNAGLAFFSSHPATEDRIEETTALLAEMPEGLGLKVSDRGRFEIIQRRIRLLTRKIRPTGRTPL
ncbi:MAG: M48 family metalloprotease [Deltaproteobacteria bacterium]|nr:M48 family metalloprotease [Deltaproteobacteria bacterium]MBW2398102.1 M48 family metalloprotease [Deltaproteobacteria bacterium]MBW2666020.1 M48 family metalloprotease [Deltaproteobacteria bacterium]